MKIENEFDKKINKLSKLKIGHEIGKVKVFNLLDLVNHGVTQDELIVAQCNANGDKLNDGYYYIDMLLKNGMLLSYSMFACGVHVLTAEGIKGGGFWESVGKIIVMEKNKD